MNSINLRGLSFDCGTLLAGLSSSAAPATIYIQLSSVIIVLSIIITIITMNIIMFFCLVVAANDCIAARPVESNNISQTCKDGWVDRVGSLLVGGVAASNSNSLVQEDRSDPSGLDKKANGKWPARSITCARFCRCT